MSASNGTPAARVVDNRLASPRAAGKRGGGWGDGDGDGGVGSSGGDGDENAYDYDDSNANDGQSDATQTLAWGPVGAAQSGLAAERERELGNAAVRVFHSKLVNIAQSNGDRRSDAATLERLKREIVGAFGNGAWGVGPVECVDAWEVRLQSPAVIDSGLLERLHRVAPGLMFRTPVTKDTGLGVGSLIIPKMQRPWLRRADVALIVAMVLAIVVFIVLKGVEGFYTTHVRVLREDVEE